MILSVGKKPTDFMQLFHQSLIKKETVSKRLSHWGINGVALKYFLASLAHLQSC